ncbi:MAG: LysR family transcriptional regulator, partial [Bdellovibrionota bacterium]
MLHIKNLDLNLLLVAGALYRHKNVSRAALDLGLSQSAVSHALARLRVQFENPLFVRTSRGVSPTALARRMQNDILDLIHRAEQLGSHRTEFDPSKASDRITITSTDYFEAIVVPRLLAEIHRAAPNLTVSIRPTLGDIPKGDLETGKVDLAVAGFYSKLPEGFYQAHLASDTFQVAAAKRNSKYGAKLSIEEYFSANHALITLQGDFHDDIKHRVGSKHLKRQIIYGSYSFTGMAWVLQESNMLLTAPSLLLKQYQRYFPLRVWDGPIDLGKIDIKMIWHSQTHEDPLRKWFRAKLKAAFRVAPSFWLTLASSFL